MRDRETNLSQDVNATHLIEYIQNDCLYILSKTQIRRWKREVHISISPHKRINIE